VKPLYAKHRNAWRAWLRRNGRSAPDVWLIYHKKHSNTPSVTFDEALDEALCFGWVDARVKAFDENRYLMRFVPRKPTSSWSPSNIERVKRLLQEGRMTAAGRAAFVGHERRRTVPPPTKLPAELARTFRATGKPWETFASFPKGYQRAAIGWVASAKKPETRLRRLERLIAHSERGERLAFI